MPPRKLALLESEDTLRLTTWVQLARTFSLIHRRVASLLLTHDLTMPQFDVLATLRYSEGVTQQELAARLLVTKGNVCGVLDRLEALKWVERRPDPADRRANRLHLTAPGKRRIDAILPHHDRLIAQATGGLTANEAKSLRALLFKLEVGNES